MSNKSKAARGALHAATKGQGEAPKPLPDTLTLSVSQAGYLRALQIDLERFNQQAQQIQQAIQQTLAARIDTLQEIASTSGISVDEIGANYQFDGQNLIKPPSQK